MNKAFLFLDLLKIDEIFKRLGCQMFLLYGTALGAYRDGDFLPGDNDLDLGSFDISRRDEIAEAMRQAGFEVSTCWDEKIQGYRESEMIHASHDVHVDVFFFVQTKEGYMASRSVEEEYFVLLPPTTENKLEPVTFLGHTFNVLYPIEEYLAFCYDDWKDPTKKDSGKLYHDLLGKKFEKTIYT